MTGVFDGLDLVELAHRVMRPAHLVTRGGDGALGLAERPVAGTVAAVPAMYPEWLGDQGFTEAHEVRFPYVAGEMAQGIASVELVDAMARAEMLAFFGVGGLALDRFDHELDRLSTRLAGRRNWGVNLTHRPDDAANGGRRRDPAAACRCAEDRAVGVPRHHTRGGALRGLRPTNRYDGQGHPQDRDVRQGSRPETAELFLSPPPPSLVRRLVEVES